MHARPLIHLFAPNGEKYKATITPTPGFSPTADAEHLKKAMKGIGTDEKAIVKILGRRTTHERMAIREVYPSISSKTLEEALKSDLSGKFEDFCLLLIKSPAEIMAEALYKAMKGLGTKERVLNEIIGGISKSEVGDLKEAYEKDAIKGDTHGDYRDALLLVLEGHSDEPETQQLKKLTASNLNEFVNVSLAEQDAKEIYDSGEGRMGTKESRFMRPIINRSVIQLNATNEAYIKKYGKSLVDAIRKETSRDFKDFLTFKVRYATDRAALFAELLNFSMKGFGTRDATLQRTLALRADETLFKRDLYQLQVLACAKQYARPLIHLFAPDGEKYKPTISPTPGFSPTADAEHLKKAMKGLGTNENAILSILGRRTTYERMAIRDAYPSISSKTLDAALKSDLSGKFGEFCQILIQSPAQIMAEALYKAMKGLGTKERVINEILGGISKAEISDLKIAFEKVSGGKTLEDAIKGDTSGHYQEALLMILAGQSDEPQTQQLKGLSPANINEFVNTSLAEQDAKEIYDSGEGHVGTAEGRFMRPILNRSVIQLNATNKAYIKNYGKPLVEAIKKETSRDFENLLVYRVRYATERAALFAELLHSTMKGAGTLDATLQRTLALRADTDLGSIKDKYSELYGESLEDAIKGDTSGDYKALCLKLIGI
ncbi:unnamed protein product [Hymenolepis diminuta]|uniref:Annexin n=1 Tax=Hymenolepis diminuta TaxID=6216 RepID=A0A3P7BHR6_HYMDI|nr:unnamed protein product [Hymenolepis diminuta]